MAIQLPATCTTARCGSSRASTACCESSMRVEGSSSPARICCHSSARSGPSLSAAAAGRGSRAAPGRGGNCGLGTSALAAGLALGAAGAGTVACGEAWACGEAVA